MLPTLDEYQRLVLGNVSRIHDPGMAMTDKLPWPPPLTWGVHAVSGSWGPHHYNADEADAAHKAAMSELRRERDEAIELLRRLDEAYERCPKEPLTPLNVARHPAEKAEGLPSKKGERQ